MKIMLIVILFIAFMQGIFAQKEDGKKELGFSRPKYYQDFLNFKSAKPGLTRMDIFIDVPYTEMHFVKTDDNFQSDYSVTISVFEEDKEKLVEEKLWDEKINVKDFQQTISPGNYNISIKSFDLKPGKYFIRTAVEDKDTRKTFASTNMYTLRNFDSLPNISDIMFIAKESVVSGSKKILPNVTRQINVQKEGIPLFFEVYTSKPQKVKMEFKVSEGEKKIILIDTLYKDVDSGKTQVFHNIKIRDLGLGSYLVDLKLLNSENNSIASTVKSFSSRWIGIPSVITDLDKAIAQLVYIATSSEKNYIQDATTKEEKIQRYMEFWKKKDPNPADEDNQVFDEYYRRINFANVNFSHYIEGWRTDRGMVYITLGAPNNIDRHPFDYDAKPYEIWEYYDLNQRFVFMDESGFGDYRLMTPMYGDAMRYRY
jgi:GWxTD domain-containing protein